LYLFLQVFAGLFLWNKTTNLLQKYNKYATSTKLDIIKRPQNTVRRLYGRLSANLLIVSFKSGERGL